VGITTGSYTAQIHLLDRSRVSALREPSTDDNCMYDGFVHFEPSPPTSSKYPEMQTP